MSFQFRIDVILLWHCLGFRSSFPVQIVHIIFTKVKLTKKRIVSLPVMVHYGVKDVVEQVWFIRVEVAIVDLVQDLSDLWVRVIVVLGNVSTTVTQQPL